MRAQTRHIRPNPIGYSIVQRVERYENMLKVRGLEVLEGTLLLDIKPYVPGIDEVKNAKASWLEGRMKTTHARRKRDTAHAARANIRRKRTAI